MHIEILPSDQQAATKAAQQGASEIKNAIAERGEAFIILATGASQFLMLEALVDDPEIDWSKVTAFHLDEYVGISESHPASFVRYLRERFLAKVPDVRQMVLISGDEKDVQVELARINRIISAVNIDVAFVGIGENGHLAFNDPPADFATNDPYIYVELDEKCRWQQTNEGWFKTYEDVPSHAISMSVNQIMKSAAIICTVLDARKAEAARLTIEAEVSPLRPASILQGHDHTHIYLDKEAASLLDAAE